MTKGLGQTKAFKDFATNRTKATIASAVTGGTAAVLGGGKFRSGAITGSFSYLFAEGVREYSISRRARIMGGSNKQRAAVRGALGRIDATERGRELSDAISVDEIQINIKEITPLNAYAIAPNTVNLALEFVDGPVCCYITAGGEAPFTLNRVLVHELGHLTGIRDDGFMNMNNVNRWENYIMRELAPNQPDRTSYSVNRLEPIR